MKRTRGAQLDALLEELAAVSANLREYAKKTPSSRARLELERAAETFRETMDESIHPHELPNSVFDPSDTRMFGQFAALALVAQQREPLSQVPSTFGGGVYALYYIGSFSPYAPISTSETPIYVGKAQPRRGAQTVREQGPAITARLAEHAKSIALAQSTLDVNEFECRRLVVAPGWEMAAEAALMALFRPLWNYQHGPVHGLGKHGDKAETRGNKRSPWDTLHPGRKWAGKTIHDQKPAAQILADISAHFDAHPPIATQKEVLASYLGTVGNYC